MVMMAHARLDHSRRLRLLASAAVMAMLAVGNRRLQDHRIGRAFPDIARWHRLPAPTASYGKHRTPGANAIAPIRTIRRRRSITRRRCAASGNGRRPSAVLEQASIQNPKNMELLGAYGRALADVGNYQQALDVLGRAHTPDRPDWRILSVQGAVLDQMGRHEDAQRYYATALKIVPDEPSVLSNLRPVLCARERPGAGGDDAAARRRALARSARAAEPRAGGRLAGPLRGGRIDRARRPAA